jgi:ferric-dicitrate binding protein FerR (iron transport regulator)
VVYLAGRSSFSFPVAFHPGPREVVLKGEAFFDVSPDPLHPFIIETEEARIEVLGTAFNVRTQNGRPFELSVDRGKVRVTLKKDPSAGLVVTAGEKIADIGNRLVKSTFVPGGETGWYKQRMQFKDEPLAQIISVLNRNFNTTFAVAEESVGKRRMTVTFRDETPETMTQLICLTLNLKSDTLHGSVVLSENKGGSKGN